MSESVILCEGFHDRAFWDGWLTFLGCDSSGFKPDTPGFPKVDPWGRPVRQGQFAFRSKSGAFLRIRPCNGKSNVVQEARIRLKSRTTHALVRLVINVDVDSSAAGATQPVGLNRQDILQIVKQFDPQAAINADGDIKIDAATTTISLLRWEVNAPPAQGIPDQQTLERLVCAALAAAYPNRATSVQSWLDQRPAPPPSDPKDHAWTYMAGWYAQFGCEAFYSNLWKDAQVRRELETRLKACGVWQVAEALANGA